MHGISQAVQEIASVVGNGPNPPIICGLARALTKDIDVSTYRDYVTVLFGIKIRYLVHELENELGKKRKLKKLCDWWKGSVIVQWTKRPRSRPITQLRHLSVLANPFVPSHPVKETL